MTTYRFRDPAKCPLPDPVLKSEVEQLGDGSNDRKAKGGNKPFMRYSTTEWPSANRSARAAAALVIFHGPKPR